MRTLLLIAAAAFCFNAASAQDKAATTAPKPAAHEAMAMKEHVCNPGCKGDKHNYVHGEKGHVCSPECAKMHGGDMKKEGEMKKEAPKK